jgi:hypothetical protein
MKALKIYDKVYRVTLLFIVEKDGEKAKAWLTKAFKDGDTVKDLSFAWPIGAKSIWDNDSCKEYAIWIRSKKDVGHLVHETSHIANMVLGHRGIYQRENNMEAHAYYQEFLFNEFMKIMK